MAPLDLSRGAAKSDPETGDQYTARLLKLIPSEAAATYTAGHATANLYEILPYWALVCLLLGAGIRAIATRDVKVSVSILGQIQWVTTGIVAVSFALWVHALGDHLPLLAGIPAGIASLGVLLWTTVVPRYYQGD